MTLSIDALPRTSAIARRLEVLPRTGSTNADLLAAVVAEPADWPHLSTIVTDDQTAGRGRRDRSWTAAPGTALAVSVLIHAHELPPAQRGWIPLLAGVAMASAVAQAARVRSHTVRLKWPNDVLIDGLKVSGILAEGVPGYPDAIVVGAGVNTHMSRADLPVPTAVSFEAIGVDVDEDVLLETYLHRLSGGFDALVAAGDASVAGLRGEVEAVCETIGSAVMVSLPDGSTLTGTAVRLGPAGELVVDSGIEHAVFAGDVVHVRPHLSR